MEPKSIAPARVFSFDVKFTGTRKTLFYRRLFGYSSSTKRSMKDGSTKIYTHVEQGLLGVIPHVKLGKSVFAVPKAAAARLEAFFSDLKWRPLELHTFDAMLPQELKLRAMRKTLETRRVGEAVLKGEIEALRQIIERGRVGGGELTRIRLVLRAAGELTRLDWSEGREFSNELEARLGPLKKAAR